MYNSSEIRTRQQANVTLYLVAVFPPSVLFPLFCDGPVGACCHPTPASHVCSPSGIVLLRQRHLSTASILSAGIIHEHSNASLFKMFPSSSHCCFNYLLFPIESKVATAAKHLSVSPGYVPSVLLLKIRPTYLLEHPPSKKFYRDSSGLAGPPPNVLRYYPFRHNVFILIVRPLHGPS